ncbi:16S rRNA (cytidine(1402)-2'-O)-methyltransferase [Synechocystis sp. LEGE 06083]|uniref:16S rRNA (cytidine(1402)-2'-O)-methyltransferase n=1 Tax=Synechocystis sp. LEGE 06083 TaxID=915336 RepID=UPI00188046E0|nr:16S rRNA (cytidine(1402)-2'-O)-methyltransferase [Synechocystis sp. LEGE 06083]MBE9194589.1 16S rRNA (cytidine(1402)-2'-O)-methyltransferase [Synechocystis sp. LEGE 06083]
MGILYLVATPIGNLGDMTPRAIKTLQEVDLIAAEDTRHTGKLLQHFQITTPQISYHDHNRHGRTQELLAKLQKGQNIALVSDAGTPGISDPGQELVAACGESNIEVIPIPGATALIAALISSGLATERFVFEGFLPTKNQSRQQLLQSLVQEQRTIILYEAPHRLLTTLTDLQTVLGAERNLTVARELTKYHEQFWRGNLQTAIAYFTENTPKGEFCLVIAGAPADDRPSFSEENLRDELKNLINKGLSRSQASKQLAEVTRLPRRQLYQLSLEIEADS